MLNPNLKLNQNILNDEALVKKESVPIRKGFGEGLLEAGEKDARVVGLCADLTESTQMHFFKQKFPSRFIDVGVAEQNLASVASGLAAMGKIPFITSYAMFSPGRNWEQIRTTICYNDRKVIIAGSHAGISVGPDGGTHQAIEDIALTRVIPNMTVISPCDAIEAKKATLACIESKIKTPVYIRLAREKTPVMTTEETPFEIGKAQIVWKAETLSAVGIIATGALLFNAIKAANILKKEGIDVAVVNVATIKPLDEETIIDIAKETARVNNSGIGKIVTVEEHQIIGGLGGAVAELLSEKFPSKIERVGIKDTFGQSGTPDELIKHYKMSTEDIIEAVRLVLR